MKNLAHCFRCILSYISPKLNTHICYLVKFKRFLNLSNPITLNEKILWLKFNTYWNNTLIKNCADKYLVRDYLKKKGFGYILNNLIAVYDGVDLIEWDKLPESFVIKLNVGCGANLIVRNRSNLDINQAHDEIKNWFNINFWAPYSEMQYKDVDKHLMVEEFLGDEFGNLPNDYKFYCMNGICKYVMVCDERENGKHAKFYYFDRDWNMMPYTKDAVEHPNKTVKKPEVIDEAFNIAEKLSKDFPFVRVDLYIVENKIYFGELTFTPSAGLDNGRAPYTDRILGEQLQLPIL